MNLIIDDNDHQLIIKVASIPSARIQIYFIDNDDYFTRKAVLTDAEARSSPTTTNGRYSSRAACWRRCANSTGRPPSSTAWDGCRPSRPSYLKKVFNDDPLFRDVKVVVSLCADRFEKPLSEDSPKK